MSLNEVFQMFQVHKDNSFHMSDEELQQSAKQLGDAINSLSPDDKDMFIKMISQVEFKPVGFAFEGGCV
jgi:hypothetical protein